MSATREKPRKRSKARRFETLNLFIDRGLKTLTKHEAFVWLVLYRDTKPNGVAETGIADIARRIGATPRSVKRAIAALVKRGVVRVVRRGGPSIGPSRYTVNPWMTIDDGGTGEVVT